MTRIPASALLLGLAGLLPFLWGAAGILAPGLTAWSLGFLPGTVPWAGGDADLRDRHPVLHGGRDLGLRHAGDGRQAGLFYALSVLPPIWAFFFATGPTGPALAALLAGFVALLPIDWTAMRAGLAPVWWMQLRLLLTTVVSACLIVGLGPRHERR
jgi:hypothetical protein